MQRKYKGLSDLNVLVIDDTELVLTMMSTLLLTMGVKTVTTADSVEAALEKLPVLDRVPYDVIFLDLYLGKRSGLEILKAVRKRDPEIPIIMLTQENEAKKVLYMITEGATDYIVKPFNEEIIATKLERVLGRPISRVELI